mgnify:CR=1 FL=1
MVLLFDFIIRKEKFSNYYRFGSSTYLSFEIKIIINDWHLTTIGSKYSLVIKIMAR